MKNKYFYPIFKLKAKSWIRYWLLKKTEFKGKLSEILTGFSFNLQNTLRRKFVKFEIEGNSIQDGEPSPENEVPIKSAGENVNLFDGEFINGSESVPDSVYYLFSKNDLKLKNNTYTFNNSLPNSFSYAIMGCINSFPNSDTKQYNSGWKTGGTPLTFSFSQELYFGVLIKKSNGSTIQSEDIISYKFNLQQGTIAFPYSPYGQGCITEKIINKNWFDNTKILNAFIANNKMDVGANLRTLYLPCLPNTTYTMQKKAGQRFQFGCTSVFPNTGVDVYNLQNNPTGTSLTLTTTANAKYLVAYFYSFTADTVPYQEMLDSIQIELGSTASDYVAHEEQTYSIYTQQPFRSIGDVRDVFFKNTVDSPYYDENLVENGWYERHLRRIRLTSDMTITAGQYGVNTYVVTLTDNCKYVANTIVCKSTHFRGVPYEDRGAAGNNIIYTIPAGNKFEIRNTEFATIEAFKTLLDDNEVYVEYIPVEPINLPCIQSQIDILENIPSTFAGQTNVFSLDEVEPYLKIQYWESDENG